MSTDEQSKDPCSVTADEGRVLSGPETKVLLVGEAPMKMPRIGGGLGQMLIMAMALGDERTRGQVSELLGPDHPSQRPRVEDDPRFHRPEKISPAEFFISTGPGPVEGKHYAVVMAPDDTEDSGYKVMARSKYGFDDPADAKADAGKQFPSLPVLSGPEQYSYPFYDMRKMRILIEADQRRKRRADKAHRDAERSKQGQSRAYTHIITPSTGRNDTYPPPEVRVEKNITPVKETDEHN